MLKMLKGLSIRKSFKRSNGKNEVIRISLKEPVLINEVNLLKINNTVSRDPWM